MFTNVYSPGLSTTNGTFGFVTPNTASDDANVSAYIFGSLWSRMWRIFC